MRLLVSCGTYKTSFNIIDDSKVIFLDSNIGTLSLFATLMSCYLVILIYELGSTGNRIM